MVAQPRFETAPPGALTPRQCQVLDLLLQHKTVKEIARDLAISPHTVEQRIRIAKDKLRVTRRSELIAAYKRADPLYGKTVYADSHIENLNQLPSQPVKPSASDDPFGEQVFAINMAGNASTDRMVPLVPALFEGPNGTVMRVGAVFAIAATIMIAGIGGLSIMEQLSRILMP